MELQTDLAALREKYQKIMAKFTYQGKEPEAKERLRHLFHNQMTSVSSLAPEPQDWNAWTEACVQKKDWLGLCRVINQRNKNAMMPVIYGGYTYEKNVHCVLESFLCGNVQAMERILPLQLAQVKNCNDPFFPAAAHVLIGLWYQDASILEWAVPDAERFLEGKKPNLLQKAMVSFLLDLVSGNMDKGSEDLLEVCKGYPKDKRPVLGIRPFCTYAHGLYCLAQLLLPKNTFQTLKLPEYKLQPYQFLSGKAITIPTKNRRRKPGDTNNGWTFRPKALCRRFEPGILPPEQLVYIGEGCGGGAGAHTLQRADGTVMRTVWNGGLALAGTNGHKKTPFLRPRRSMERRGNCVEIFWMGRMGSAAARVRDPPVWENSKNKRPPDFYVRGPSRR